MPAAEANPSSVSNNEPLILGQPSGTSAIPANGASESRVPSPGVGNSSESRDAAQPSFDRHSADAPSDELSCPSPVQWSSFEQMFMQAANNALSVVAAVVERASAPPTGQPAQCMNGNIELPTPVTTGLHSEASHAVASQPPKRRYCESEDCPVADSALPSHACSSSKKRKPAKKDKKQAKGSSDVPAKAIPLPGTGTAKQRRQFALETVRIAQEDLALIREAAQVASVQLAPVEAETGIPLQSVDANAKPAAMSQPNPRRPKNKSEKPSPEDFAKFVRQPLFNADGHAVTWEEYTTDVTVCVTCATTAPIMWRTHRGLRMCNACAIYARLHDEPRPELLQQKAFRSRKHAVNPAPPVEDGEQPRKKQRKANAQSSRDKAGAEEPKAATRATNTRRKQKALPTPLTTDGTTSNAQTAPQSIATKRNQRRAPNQNTQRSGISHATSDVAKAGDFITAATSSPGVFATGHIKGFLWEGGQPKYIVQQGRFRRCHQASQPAVASDFLFSESDKQSAFIVDVANVWLVTPTALDCSQLFSGKYAQAQPPECPKCAAPSGESSDQLLSTLAGHAVVHGYNGLAAENAQRRWVYGLPSLHPSGNNSLDMLPLDNDAMEAYAAKLLDLKRATQ